MCDVLSQWQLLLWGNSVPKINSFEVRRVGVCGRSFCPGRWYLSQAALGGGPHEQGLPGVEDGQFGSKVHTTDTTEARS